MYVNLRIKVPAFIESIVVYFLLRYRKKHYGLAFRRIKLTKGEYAIVDPQDYQKLSKYDWQLFENSTDNFYAVRIEGRKVISMHRVIMNVSAEAFVDHKDHNDLNNRKENLRIVTKAQNQYNRRKTSRKTTSKYKGVYYKKTMHKYCAVIGCGGKRMYLGYYDNEADAARAYDVAAKLYHKEFASLNFPDESQIQKRLGLAPGPVPGGRPRLRGLVCPKIIVAALLLLTLGLMINRLDFLRFSYKSKYMQKIKNPLLSQLFMETSFVPKGQQLKQLAAAEELYKIVEPDRQYPYEFICFKITGYRPKSQTAQQTINSKELIDDLPTYVLRASARLKLRADQQSAMGWLTPQGEKVYTINELSEKFNVSKRTIERWRKRGLLARKYIFGRGISGIGFTSWAVEEFAGKNTELVKSASQFSTTSPAAKQAIIDMAQQLGSDGGFSRTAIIKKTAAHFKRAAETVRLIVADYEKRHKRQIFKNTHSLLGSKETALIYSMYESGAAIERIADKFSKSVSTIYRIIDRKRIRMLLAAKIDYIMSNEFQQPDAKGKILAAPVSVRRAPKGLLRKTDIKPDKNWQEFVETIKKIPALNREQEVELFRRYNFLKFLAAGLVKQLSLTKPCARAAQQAEQYLNQAERMKNLIIEANLKLVVRVAGRHASGSNLADLISEGNMALIRTVEKFDYARGFRFSTYASWAIEREFARFQPTGPGGTEMSDFDEISVSQHLKTRSAGVEAIEKARSSLEQVIAENLTEREQHIIRYHFGLTGSVVKKEFKTLKQIGDELGISKERVRQIELIALGKLRQTLSAEEFELLTG